MGLRCAIRGVESRHIFVQDASVMRLYADGKVMPVGRGSPIVGDRFRMAAEPPAMRTAVGPERCGCIRAQER